MVLIYSLSRLLQSDSGEFSKNSIIKIISIPYFRIALEDATLENGCLRFIRASHNNGIHRRYIRNPDKNSKDILTYDRPEPIYQLSNFTACPVKAGLCENLFIFFKLYIQYFYFRCTCCHP